MKVSKFHKDYSDGENYSLKDIFEEIKELLIEVIKFNKSGIIDELGDVSANFQLWLYIKYKKDSDLWRLSLLTYKKLRNRKKIWKRIYKMANLKIKDNYCGNYKRKEKIINRLIKYKVSINKANIICNKILK